jgi:putative ABC transport system ATP-binding protein
VSDAPSRPPKIRMRGVRRTFRVGDQDVHALAGIDVDIEAGEYVAIMGSSGSGKSTLLNVVGLLDRPDGGEYELDGRVVSGLGAREAARIREQEIGFVFQFFQLVPRLTAAANIELPLVLAGMAPAERRRRVQQQLEAFGLTARADHRPGELSGGQRQRVAIARATIHEPGLLLADEPTGNLDRHSGEGVIEVLERLNSQGVTLIVVTHDPVLGKRARRLLRMEDGAIVEDVRAVSAPEKANA